MDRCWDVNTGVSVMAVYLGVAELFTNLATFNNNGVVYCDEYEITEFTLS